MRAVIKRAADQISDWVHTLPRTSVLGSTLFNHEYARLRRRMEATGLSPRVADERAFRATLARWPRA